MEEAEVEVAEEVVVGVWVTVVVGRASVVLSSTGAVGVVLVEEIARRSPLLYTSPSFVSSSSRGSL